VKTRYRGTSLGERPSCGLPIAKAAMPTATGVRIPTPSQMLAQKAIVESQW
jgi:hypothetical protein